MKPKIILSIVAFIFVSESLSGSFPSSFSRPLGSCGPLTCTSSNGINVKYGENNLNDTAYISATAIISLHVYGPQCSTSLTGITLDGVPVSYTVYSSSPYSCAVNLLSQPGMYKVSGMVQGGSQYVYFALILSPVGLKKNSKEEDENIQVFPNPTESNVTILSKKAEIKFISIFNALGKEIQTEKASGHSFDLQLYNYTSGIYFIQVATLNDKVSIKKLIVR